MRPQYFPWLFDDKNAWEKAFADPRYSYDMPIDYFMAIYQVERKDDAGAPMRYSMPELSAPSSLPAAFTAAPVPAFFSASTAPTPVVAAPKEESKHEEGILSQEEIDALLSGI